MGQTLSSMLFSYLVHTIYIMYTVHEKHCKMMDMINNNEKNENVSGKLLSSSEVDSAICYHDRCHSSRDWRLAVIPLTTTCRLLGTP